mgnify:CR=1 FL=1
MDERQEAWSAGDFSIERRWYANLKQNKKSRIG